MNPEIPGSPPCDPREDVVEGFAARYIARRARQLVRRSGCSESDREDIEQELKGHLLERLPRFDPQRGNWTTFVVLVISCRIANWREHWRASCRYPPAVSLNAPANCEEMPAERQAFLPTTVDRRRPECLDEKSSLEMRLDVEAVLDKLDPHDRRTCRELSRRSLTQSAEMLGVPRTTLGDQCRRWRQQFRKDDLDGYL